MSSKLHVTEVGRVAVPASDQDRALELYVGALAFELRTDVTLADGKMGGSLPGQLHPNRSPRLYLLGEASVSMWGRQNRIPS